jgi:hypothetical protein
VMGLQLPAPHEQGVHRILVANVEALVGDD